MWVVPDEGGITPGYEQLEIEDELLRGGLVPVASGMDKHDGHSAIRIKNRYAALHAARLGVDQSVELPEAPYLHLFVPRGMVDLEGAGTLNAGDAVRFTATGGQKVTAARAVRDPGLGDARRSRGLGPWRVGLTGSLTGFAPAAGECIDQ